MRAFEIVFGVVTIAKNVQKRTLIIKGIMPKAVIFDLNGVFVKSPKLSERFSAAFGVPEATFLAALKNVMAKVRLPGAGAAFAYWQPHFTEWGVKISEEEFFRFWFGAEKLDADMVELARQLKRAGLRVLLLSNNFAERAAYYDKTFPALREVADAMYYSWETGLVKPERAAFEHLLADQSLSADECLYFDDSEANIKTAKDLGIQAFRFEGAEGIKTILRENGVFESLTA